MTRSRLRLRRLRDSMPKSWQGRPLRRRRPRRRPPTRRRRLLLAMRRKRSRRRWPAGGRKRRKTGRGRRLRLPGRDRLRNRRHALSNKNSKLLNPAISSEKMMSLLDSNSAARDRHLPGMRTKIMMITSNSR